MKLSRIFLATAFTTTICVQALATPSFAKPILLDRLEAAVNESLILRSDILRFRKTITLRSQLDPLFSGSEIAKKGGSANNSEIVDFLISEKLISSHLPVKDGAVEQEINTIQANNGIDRATLKRAILEQGFLFTDYFEMIRASISKRNLIDRDIRTRVQISDDDIKNYFYNEYPLGNRAAAKYKIRILRVTPSNFTTTSAARKTIQRAKKALDAGESFAEVTRRFSDDPTSSSGGNLGFMDYDEISEGIRKEIIKLKVGGISEILGNDQSSYFVLKLDDIRSGKEDRLKELQAEIRQKLTSDEYRHQIDLWLSRQRQTAYVHLAGEK